VKATEKAKDDAVSTPLTVEVKASENSDRECFTLAPSPGVIPCEYPDKFYFFRN